MPNSRRENQRSKSKGDEIPEAGNTPRRKESVSQEKDVTSSKSETTTGNSKQMTLDKHFQNGTGPMTVDIEKSLASIQSRLESSQEYIQNLAKNMLTEDILKNSLDTLKTDMQEHIKQELSKVYTKVETLKQSVNDVETALTEIKDVNCGLEMKVETVEKENQKLKEENESLRSLANQQSERIKFVEKDLNNLEQYTRRNSIRIYGLDDANKQEKEDETAEKVVKLVKDKLHVNIRQEDIDIAHRIGKFTGDSNRPVICKFLSRTKKMAVIRSRKQLKGTAIVIKEDLTNYNAKRLAKANENASVESAWSDNGKIIALLKNKRKIVIDHKTDLTKPLY